MIVPERLVDRIKASGLSYTAVANRVGVKQPTITRLARGDQRRTTRLSELARVLQTTPAYLSGETDDPNENAPLRPAPPIAQFVTMTVALPNEEVLTQMFLAMLGSAIDAEKQPLQGVELARDLAMLLPSALGNLRGPLIELRSDDGETLPVRTEDDDAAAPARRRA